MTRLLFAYLCGSAFASLVLAAVSMVAGQWGVATLMLAIGLVSVLGLIAVRAVELRRERVS